MLRLHDGFGTGNELMPLGLRRGRELRASTLEGVGRLPVFQCCPLVVAGLEIGADCAAGRRHQAEQRRCERCPLGGPTCQTPVPAAASDQHPPLPLSAGGFQSTRRCGPRPVTLPGELEHLVHTASVDRRDGRAGPGDFGHSKAMRARAPRGPAAKGCASSSACSRVCDNREADRRRARPMADDTLVFISYARDDGEQHATELVKRLARRAGHRALAGPHQHAARRLHRAAQERNRRHAVLRARDDACGTSLAVGRAGVAARSASTVTLHMPDQADVRFPRHR